jgi:serine-type D-Ala-D-Ala carboxypeptidase (penicillin-binding protein 5/6)
METGHFYCVTTGQIDCGTTPSPSVYLQVAHRSKSLESQIRLTSQGPRPTPELAPMRRKEPATMSIPISHILERIRAGAWASFGGAMVVTFLFSNIPLQAQESHAVVAPQEKVAGANLPALKQGDTGRAVEDLQRRLNARLEPSPELDVDGDFGAGTRTALMRFQRSKGLQPSGVADAKTWEALRPAPAVREVPKPEVVNAQAPPKEPADAIEGPPYVTAKAWAIADGRTGATLWGSDETKPLDMASTTKIMTAFLIARQVKAKPEVLDEVVTFTARADNTSGSTSGVKSGERVTVRELLYGLLLPSGNDAAVAFAEHFGGRMAAHNGRTDDSDPLPRFVAEMNRVADELHLKETHFANPHGLPASEHHTSARDLARLTALALADPVLARVVSTPRHGSSLLGPDGQARNVVWNNTNRLLAIEGYDGVKTGTTSSAGNCLVASGHRGDGHLIVVILGSSSGDGRYADARNLFRWAWRQRGETPGR